MRVGLDSVVFAYDFDRLTSGGLLYDHGPHGLHATPGAGAAAPTRQLDGSYYFDGGDYFALSGASQARFYANAPTAEHTWVASFNNPTVGTCAMFSCDNANAGGTWKGLMCVANGGINQLIYHLQGVAALPGFLAQYTSQGTNIHNTVVSSEATPRGIDNCKAMGIGAWVAPGFGTVVYDTAQVPRIGMGAYQYTGYIRYLALLRGAVSSADMAELSAMLCNGFKPFCVR